MLDINRVKIAVIGLGYVGLPLAVEFGKRFPTLGFDIDQGRVNELKKGYDKTLECESEILNEAVQLSYTSSLGDLESSNVYVVTVPTPIDKNNQPDLGPLLRASRALGDVVAKGDVVIYESTVYPGATEEECIPEIERVSGLVLNRDFFVGYSPERVNPGDRERRITDIIKLTSGSTPEAADFIDQLYSRIITAGTHKSSSIRVAEAAKVIENTQRDVNIALVNELSIIFCKLGIDTQEVLEAAGTKWNFLPFRPGLVGGHCIGVDPYYLTTKAQAVGYHPEIILAGRRLNDGMGKYVAANLLKLMIRNCLPLADAKVLVMGLAFKENCPDLRNTKVVDTVAELTDYRICVDVMDPWCSADEAVKEYGIDLVGEPRQNHYDAVILAVAHSEFKNMGADAIRKFCKPRHIFYDLKSVFSKEESDIRL